MRGQVGQVRRFLTDPRVQALVLVLALLLALALAWHLVVMADHSGGMLGACIALVGVWVLLLPLPSTLAVGAWPASTTWAPTAPARVSRRLGRDPPTEGSILLM